MFFVFSARGVENYSGIIESFLLFGRHGILVRKRFYIQA